VQVQDTPSPPRRARTSRGLTAAFAGYDAFVSYARSDATAYARALGAGLEAAGLVAFVDYQAIPPGEALTATLRRGIRRSRMLVVICSRAAVQSQWVGLEVAEAVRRGRKVVLINVDHAYAGAKWPLDPDIVWVPETGAALLNGQPSRGIVEEVLNRVEHTRRQNVVVRVFAAAMLVLVALLAAVAWNWRQAVLQRETALAQKLVALSETETQRAPQNVARISLLLLESLRRRETPEAVGALANSVRLLRPMLADVKAGKNVREAVFSPNGEWVAASGLSDADRPLVGVWSAATLEKRWTREASTGKPPLFGVGMAWSPDSREVVWSGGGNTAELLAADTGAVIQSIAVAGNVSRVAMSPDGKWIAVGDLSGNVTVWDRAARTVAATLKAGRNVLAMAFAADGSALVFGGGLESRPGTTAFASFSVLGIATPSEWSAPVRTIQVPGAVMESTTPDPSGRYLAIPGSVGRMYDIQTGQDVGGFGQGQFVGMVAFSRSGRYLATTSSDRTVRVFDLEKGGEAARFVHDDGVTFAAFSDDERTVATAGNDNTVRLWRVAGQNPTQFSVGSQPAFARMLHEAAVGQVRFGSKGERLLTTSADGHLRLWSTSPNSTFRLVTNEALLGLAISPDGRWMATAGADYRPGLWDLTADTEPRRLVRHDNDLSDAKFSADGKWLATADSDEGTRIFRTDTFAAVAQVEGRRVALGRDEIVTVAGNKPARRFAVPSGNMIEEIAASGPFDDVELSAKNVLALASRDGTVVLRDLRSRPSVERARMQNGKGVSDVAFAPGGDLLASGGEDGLVRVWRESGELDQTLNLGEAVTAVAFDRSGGFIAAGGKTGTILVWSLSSGAPVARFGGSQQVNTLAFTPAGPDVLFAGGYGGFRSALWRPADLAREACARLPRRLLSPDEWLTFVGDGTPVGACVAPPGR
jgi:WD40 repeat protein